MQARAGVLTVIVELSTFKKWQSFLFIDQQANMKRKKYGRKWLLAEE